MRYDKPIVFDYENGPKQILFKNTKFDYGQTIDANSQDLWTQTYPEADVITLKSYPENSLEFLNISFSNIAIQGSLINSENSNFEIEDL